MSKFHKEVTRLTPEAHGVEKETTRLTLEAQFIEFFPQKPHDPGIITRAHIHPAIEFIYITKGVFEIGVDNEQFTAQEGDLALFRANAIHTIRFLEKGEGEYYVLKIHPTLLFQIFSGDGSNACVIPFIHKNTGDRSLFPADALSEEIKSVWRSMILEHARSDNFFFAIERAYAASLLVALLRTVIKPRASLDAGGELSEKSVSLIYESVKYINDNYASDITPADCAASIHLSYSYFAKLFRAVMGKTFKEYLTGVRLAKAHNILISTNLPITDVAASCGYGNLSYFISEYRRVYDKTPRDTRKALSDK